MRDDSPASETRIAACHDHAMTRLLSAAILGMVLTACATAIEINTHCGLNNARVEYQGSVWRFEDAAVLESTEMWPSFSTAFQILAGESGPAVIAPDGSKWVLTPTDPGDRPDLTCI